jgi:hypothetical protein
VVERVDWTCQVRKNYAETNLGLKERVDSGLTWLFAQVEDAVILEDDCVPHPSFFRFCTELLARYRCREQVMTIAGSNFHFGRYQAPHSYLFSRHTQVWGWATWRRAWQHYDPAMRRWPELKSAGWLRDALETEAAVRYWSYVFQKNYESLENWDYAWKLSCWQRDGLCIIPGTNLVSNVGFRPDASHTRNPQSRFADMPVVPMSFPLRHPPQVVRDAEADALTEQTAYSGEHFLKPMFRAARAHIQARRMDGP